MRAVAMKDIVDELRAAAQGWHGVGDGPNASLSALLGNAADEIERLRGGVAATASQSFADGVGWDTLVKDMKHHLRGEQVTEMTELVKRTKSYDEYLRHAEQEADNG